MKLFRRLKKIKLRYYNRGCNDTAKEYIKQLNSSNKLHQNELKSLQANFKKHINTLIKYYQKEEKEYHKLNIKLKAQIEYGTKKKNQVREVNSTSIALANEYDETMITLLQAAGKLKALKHKMENVNEKLNNNIFKVNR